MFKDILVYVDNAKNRDNTIRVAASFAKENGASLTGLYVKLNAIPSIPLYADKGVELVKNELEKRIRNAAEAKKRFLEIAELLGVSAIWLEVDQEDHPLNLLAYIDLIIINQTSQSATRSFNNNHFINRFILETAKPVVLIPKEWNPESFGTRIVVGWNESRQAIRAIQDATPLLKRAEQVDVVTVNKTEINEVVESSEIGAYLLERNINCRVNKVSTSKIATHSGQALLNFSSENAADLIVIGGYGHSRLREMVMGGVTRFMIEKTSLPVLFSH